MWSNKRINAFIVFDFMDLYACMVWFYFCDDEGIEGLYEKDPKCLFE